MKHLLLYEKDGDIVAAYFTKQEACAPKFVQWQNRLYHFSDCIDLFDNLVDLKGRLLGFNFWTWNDHPQLNHWPKRAKNFLRTDSNLEIYLAANAEQENDCCQALGALVYQDNQNNYMIWIDEPWELWKELGFQPQQDDIPQLVENFLK